MANSYISKLKVPNDNTTYYVRDTEAQTSITNLQNTVAALGTPLDFRGVTTVLIADNATTPSTYHAASLTPPSGKVATDTLLTGTVAIYGSKEFVWDGSKWHEFGSAQISGDTAAVIRGDASMTVSGAISTTGSTRIDVVSDVSISDSASTGAVGFITGFTDSPVKYVVLNTTGTSGNEVITGVASGGTATALTGSGTPAATSMLPVTAVTNGTFSDYVSSAGSSPTWSFSVANETLTISGANGTVPTFNSSAAICKSVTAGSSVNALTGVTSPSTETVIKSAGLSKKYLTVGTGVGETYKYVKVTKTTSTGGTPNSPFSTIAASAVSLPVSVTAGSGQSSATANAYVEATS